nr:immunoglobulin heavy chain junction region [Macaca mulatta]
CARRRGYLPLYFDYW